MAASYQSIPEFYANKGVFVTGGTGFVGKVLIEKLMRSCPDIKRIFILMRPKKGQSIHERLESLVSCKSFDRVRREQPDFLSKLVVVSGDMYEPGLGLSEEDVDMLTREVNIIFHSAASVRFDEPLKMAVTMNLNGTRKVLDLAKKMKDLKAMLHVSTAYCNCDIERIEEAVYPPTLHPQKLLDAVEWMDEDILDQVTPRLLDDKPNTYTYTKQLAEYLIAETSATLPVAIVRPSIVGAGWQEPMEGWVDNFNGPTGLLAAISKGLLRSMMGDKDAIADIVPVDTVVNLMVVVAWHTGISFQGGNTRTPVYNCTTGQINTFTWGMLENMSREYFYKYPVDDCVRVPNAKFTKSSLWHQMKWVFDHQIPAAMMDLLMYASGRKAIFVRCNQRIQKSIAALNYFTSRQWHFANDNVFRLLEILSAGDKKEFNFDTRKLHWPTYIENYCIGVKRYALKEDFSSLEKARANIRRIQRVSFIFNTLLAVMLWRILIKRANVAHNLWYLMLNLAVSLFQKMPNVARS